DDAVALAGLAAPAFDVEREAAGVVAARLGFRQTGEPIADGGEGASVGRRVRARGAADRRLVDVDDLIEMFEALDLVVRGGMFAGAVQAPRRCLVERLDDQRRLAAAGDAGDAAEGAERYARGDVAQIVAARAFDGEEFAVAFAALLGDRDLTHADEVLAGEARRIAHNLFGGALRDDAAAADAGAHAHVCD